MSRNEQRVRKLYEISLAIGPEESLQGTVDSALSAYLDVLRCDVGAVLERNETPDGRRYGLVGAVPGEPHTAEPFRAGVDRLSDGADVSLPIVGETRDGSQYYVMDLPGFGALLLGSERGGLDGVTVGALEPLNEKLADACRGKRVEAQLREERNRFEAVFETIQEPLVNVVFEDGEPIVRRVNPAFEETFGYTERDLLGENLNEWIVPDGTATGEEAEELDQQAIRGESTTREVRRQTADGTGDFLYRGVPVATTETNEHFGLYVDITEEKARQRKLEGLYEKTEGILAGEDRDAVARQTIAAAEELFEDALAGVHLYDRTEEALAPAATTGDVSAVFDGEPGSYTNQDTVVWEVYSSGSPVSIQDTTTFDGTIPGGETPMGSVMLLPLGDHGVLIISGVETAAFDEADFYFARVLSTFSETALDQAQRAEGLEGIQQVTRATLDATTHEEAAETVLERIPEVLDQPLSAIWEHDSGQGELVPVAAAAKSEALFGEIPTFSGDESLAWKAFQNRELTVVQDVESHPDAYNDDSVIRSEILVPIGEFGVLATGSTRTGSFGESEQQLLETLGANLETTMRLIDRRREMELLDQVLARILRHNIRNDLTVIRGFAREIMDGCEGEPASQAARIIDHCENLAATAEHATEIRHIVMNREQREWLSLQVLLEDVARELREEYPGARIETTFECSPAVVAHPDLPVAVRHLLENGIEHHTGESRPHVRARLFETPDGVALEVTDDGPGIPDHEVDVLARHGESALEHGSGAGLWIVDRVVDYSGGTIEFDASEEGTVVTVEFEQ
jgi:PAS domain S-box-containing protein